MAGESASIAIALQRLLGGLPVRRRLAIAVFCAPVLFTLATLFFAAESAIYVVRSEVKQGTVVRLYEWPGETLFDKGQINYEPVFSFEDGDRTLEASVGSSHSSFNVAIGETAEIRHIPGDNGNVRINTWQGLWFMAVILAGFTLIAWVLALAVWGIIHAIFFRKNRP